MKLNKRGINYLYYDLGNNILFYQVMHYVNQSLHCNENIALQ